MKKISLFLWLIAILSVGYGVFETTKKKDCNLPASVSFFSHTQDDLQVFGDSLAAGFSSCDELEENKLTTGFAVPLSKKLQMPLDNRAIGGSGIESLYNEVLKHGKRKTKIKLALVGYNDAYKKIHMLEFKTCLKEMIKIMSQNADKVYIGTTPNHLPDFKPHIPNGITSGYSDATKEIVKELNLHNVYLVDINSLVVDNTVMVKDNTHFNKVGSEKIADMFYKVIMEGK